MALSLWMFYFWKKYFNRKAPGTNISHQDSTIFSAPSNEKVGLRFNGLNKSILHIVKYYPCNQIKEVVNIRVINLTDLPLFWLAKLKKKSNTEIQVRPFVWGWKSHLVGWKTVLSMMTCIPAFGSQKLHPQHPNPCKNSVLPFLDKLAVESISGRARFKYIRE